MVWGDGRIDGRRHQNEPRRPMIELPRVLDRQRTEPEGVAQDLEVFRHGAIEIEPEESAGCDELRFASKGSLPWRELERRPAAEVDQLLRPALLEGGSSRSDLLSTDGKTNISATLSFAPKRSAQRVTRDAQQEASREILPQRSGLEQ